MVQAGRSTTKTKYATSCQRYHEKRRIHPRVTYHQPKVQTPSLWPNSHQHMETKDHSFNQVTSTQHELIKSLLDIISLGCHIKYSLSFNVSSYCYRWKWIVFDLNHWLLLQKNHKTVK